MITVPNSVHENYVNPEIRNTVPLFEFIAKNAGIRRATGQFILSMNADVLIHPSILKTISERSLVQNKYYRANRLDFKPTQEVSVSGLFDAGFAVSLKGFMYYFKAGMSKRIQYWILKIFNPLRLKWELFKAENFRLANKLKLNVVYNNGAYLAHCLNSGDFMLMSSIHWAEMNAYPEYTSISTHTDAIFSVLAYERLTEHVFREPVFHQEHQRRYSWEAIQNDDSFVKAYNYFEKVANSVKKKESTKSYLNNAGWGLVDYQLLEEIING
jgi:glycosyltransferase involved in cell wall biosynthesis